jgi:LytS/YehU family sensor histidine kinase
LVEGGAIRLAVERLGASVRVAVENEFDPDAPPPSRLGMGLPHVRRRLELRYGGAASMETGGREGVYRVELRFPCESPMASSSRA